MVRASQTIPAHKSQGRLKNESGPVTKIAPSPGPNHPHSSLEGMRMADHQRTQIHAEKWHPIKGLEGRYEVSSMGRVRNLRRRKLLTPYVGSPAGHLRVDLPNGRYYVHVLVAEAFLGARPEGKEVCHGDNDPTNNHVDNLRWDTRSENVKDLRIGKRECKNGHPWEAWNVYTNPQGWQSCRTCGRIARAEYRKKVRNRG